ncbi:MAG: PilZ domain-containing protein, partial [Methylococcales bacterium]|nr:PilZ domain-containing protein [Methylococcales bacterium]
AIEIDHSIEAGEYLEIKLLLTSCIAVILLYGKVVYCKKNTDEGAAMPYQVGIDYINLNDQDREILIKHIVKRQMQQIREQKAG